MDKFTSFQDYCEAMRELTMTLIDPQEVVEAGQKLQTRLVADPNLILEQYLFLSPREKGLFLAGRPE